MPGKDDQVEKKKRGRRPHGSGSIVQLADGRWRGKYKVDGEKKERYVYSTKSEADCNRRLLAAIREAKKPAAPLTLEAYAERWVKSKIRHKANSLVAIRSRLKNHILPVFGPMQLSKITSDQIREWISDLSEELKARSVGSIYAVLHNLLDDAVTDQLIPISPCIRISLPKIKEEEATILTMEQLHSLLQELEGTDLYAMVAIAATTGLRKNEMLSLRWSEVDFTRNTIHIIRNVTRVKGAFVVDDPKSEAGERTIPLIPFTRQVLLAHRSKQNDLILRVREEGKTWEDNNLVFPSAKGGFYYARSIDLPFHRALQRAGLPYLKWHWLRHFFGTWLAMLNVPPKLAQKWMGHARIEETLGLYAHIIKKEEAKAMGVFQDAILLSLPDEENEEKKREAN